MSGCRIKPQDTSDLTAHARETDEFSCLFQLNSPLESKFVQTGKLFCIMASSSVWVSHQGSGWTASDITYQRRRQSVVVLQIEPISGIQICSEGKLYCFAITASSNAWVSHQASRYIRSDIACTWYGQTIVVLQIEPISGIQICSEGKLYCFAITASSNAWVSHQASRYIRSDIACTWYGQTIVVLQIEPISGIQICLEGKLFCNHGKFECLDVALSLKIHQIWQRMHMIRTDNRSLANRTSKWKIKGENNRNFKKFYVSMVSSSVPLCPPPPPPLRNLGLSKSVFFFLLRCNLLCCDVGDCFIVFGSFLGASFGSDPL